MFKDGLIYIYYHILSSSYIIIIIIYYHTPNIPYSIYLIWFGIHRDRLMGDLKFWGPLRDAALTTPLSDQILCRILSSWWWGESEDPNWNPKDWMASTKHRPNLQYSGVLRVLRGLREPQVLIHIDVRNLNSPLDRFQKCQSRDSKVRGAHFIEMTSCWYVGTIAVFGISALRSILRYDMIWYGHVSKAIHSIKPCLAQFTSATTTRLFLRRQRLFIHHNSSWCSQRSNCWLSPLSPFLKG